LENSATKKRLIGMRTIEYMARRGRKRRAQQHLDPELDRIRMGEVFPLDLAKPTSNEYSRRCMACGHMILVKTFNRMDITSCPKCGAILNIWDRKSKLMRNQTTLASVMVIEK
jgi:hypothetical protein